jgi:hypothetical protein
MNIRLVLLMITLAVLMAITGCNGNPKISEECIQEYEYNSKSKIYEYSGNQIPPMCVSKPR